MHHQATAAPLLLLGAIISGISLCCGTVQLPSYEGSVDVHVDLAGTKPLSDLLYGVFFEEIQHSGEGGIYAELIQDRSFEGLAWTTGFLQSNASQLALQPHHLQGPDPQRLQQRREQAQGKGLKQLRVEGSAAFGAENSRLTDQPKSWDPLPGTQATLTREDTLNAENPVAMRLSSPGPEGGIVNTGYWGIAVSEGETYALSVYLKFANADSKHNRTVRVGLESNDGQSTLASATFTDVSYKSWTRYSANLTVGDTDTAAQLRLSFPGPGELLVDVLSLFPAANLRPGYLNPHPFRDELVQYVKDLRPRFLRIPGGCIVEGDVLALRFQWKKALGSIAERPGHWDIWGYWNDDGLGMFEYLQLADELDAIPIWVANNGVAHRDEVAPKDIQPWVDDALDSLEFAMGPANSTWGKVRAAMGREEPWQLDWFAIGNEDCGHPYYVANYIAFYEAIRVAYPHMQLIANCNLGQDAPTDMWDWHLYTNSWEMFKARGAFDQMVPGRDPLVFASEYAVVDDSGFGNLKGALAEAAVMMGMERNGEVVRMAAYAPLLVNERDHWYWTNLIAFNATHVYGIPSYWVQKVFSEVQGVLYAPTTAASDLSLVHTERVAASATCQDEACTDLAVKVVNTAGMRQQATLTLSHSGRFLVHGEVNATLITGAFAEIENSLEHPHNVYPQHEVLHVMPEHGDGWASIQVSLPPISLIVLRLNLHYQTGTSEVVSHLQLAS